MSNFLPPSQSDLGVLTLLNLLQDKEASSKRLQELTEATVEANKAIQTNTEVQRDVERKQKAFQDLLSQLNKEKEDHSASVKKEYLEIEKTKATLKDQLNQLSEQIESNSKIKDSLQKMKSELETRESNVSSREIGARDKSAELAKREEAVSILEDKHKTRVQKLKDILVD